MSVLKEESSVLFRNRPVYTQKNFENEFQSIQFNKKKSSVTKGLKNFAHSYHPANLLNIFTILNLITEYDFKKYFISDLISGLTGLKIFTYKNFLIIFQNYSFKWAFCIFQLVNKILS